MPQSDTEKKTFIYLEKSTIQTTLENHEDAEGIWSWSAVGVSGRGAVVTSGLVGNVHNWLEGQTQNRVLTSNCSARPDPAALWHQAGTSAEELLKNTEIHFISSFLIIILKKTFIITCIAMD